MNTAHADTEVKKESSFPQGLGVLQQGTETLLGELRKISEVRISVYYAEIESVMGFLKTLGFVGDTMSPDHQRESLANAVKSIRRAWEKIPRKHLRNLTTVAIDPPCGIPDFLFHSMQTMGPRLRLSRNEMAAWIFIDAEEAVFFTPESVQRNLTNNEVVFGVETDAVQALFREKKWNEEVCVARGKPPTAGQDGRIEYAIDLDDLGHVPKLLESGKVSFKDIHLFAYLDKDEVLARKIPPVPGVPGCTVTNKVIKSLEAEETEFPMIPYTRLSEDGKSLLTAEMCCVSQKKGEVILEPTLRVQEDVSYASGNIDATITVLVEKDVLTGFSIITEKDICVNGVIEGARLESQKNIVAKGGIQGKEKAVIEANGDVTARQISNATVIAMGQILVDAEIMHSKIWAGARVILTGSPGHIVGGTIDADADVMAEVIGSEMGAKTVITLGKRTEDLLILLQSNQEKMEQQEEAVEKCKQVIEALNQHLSQFTSPPEEISKALKKTNVMLKTAQENLENLYAESNGLQTQYEESLKQSRTVRARKTIWPGVVINIQGAELSIAGPTGPATIVKQGDELAILPFKPLETPS